MSTALLAGCAAPRALTFVARSANASPGAALNAATAASPIVDAHCHIFSAKDIDVDAFLRALARSDELPRPLRVSVEALTGSIQRLLYGVADRLDAGAIQAALALLPTDRWPQLRALRSAVDVLRMGGTPAAHFDMLSQGYPAVQLFLPAMVDFKYWTKPRRGIPAPTRFSDQIKTMADLASAVNQRAAGPRMLPFVAFNPLRELKEGNHLAMVKDAILVHGFVGIKVYPPSGFAPTNNETDPALQDQIRYKLTTQPLGVALDAVLEELYKFCVNEHVPIMAHANNSNAMRRGAGFLASPWGWREVLSDHSKLRLNLAHFGHVEGSSQIEGASSSRCVSWAKHIVWLMNEYDYVYGDIGYSGLMNASGEFSKMYRSYLDDLLRDDAKKRLPERLMYGSDWWMSMLESSPAAYYRHVSTWFGEAYPGWTRIWGDNALQFLGIGEDGNKNAARIEARWGQWWTAKVAPQASTTSSGPDGHLQSSTTPPARSHT